MLKEGIMGTILVMVRLEFKNIELFFFFWPNIELFRYSFEVDNRTTVECGDGNSFIW